jgi:hypothetical protein
VELESSAHVQSTWSASGVGDYYGGFAHVDALDVLKVCLRRWYVVLPVVLLSLAAGLGLALQQKPTYTASGSYALVYYSSATGREALAPEARDPREGNPLAAEGAVLLGETLVADFMSGASQATLGGIGNSGTAPREPTNDTSYSVTLPEGSQSYLVQTWGKDPQSLRTVVDSVLSAAPMRATQIQERAGAPKRSQYTTFVTGATKVTKLPPTSRLKLIIAVLGVGILAGSALSLVVDRLLRSRKNRAGRVPENRSESVDTPALPTATHDSGGIMTLPASAAVQAQPPYGNQPEAVGAEQVKLESEDAASLDAAAPEHAVEEVHAMGDEELSADQADVVPVGQVEELVAEQAVEEPGDEVEELVAEQAEEEPGDEVEELVAEQAEEEPGDEAEELVAEQAEELVAEQAEEEPGEEAEELDAEHAEEEPGEEAEELDAEHAEEEPGEEAEELDAEQAEEESRVNHVDVEQHHELETTPLPEYMTEPNFDDHRNHESELDDGSWPLLEPNREFVAEGAANNHTRHRQPTH